MVVSAWMPAPDLQANPADQKPLGTIKEPLHRIGMASGGPQRLSLPRSCDPGWLHGEFPPAGGTVRPPQAADRAANLGGVGAGNSAVQPLGAASSWPGIRCWKSFNRAARPTLRRTTRDRSGQQPSRVTCRLGWSACGTNCRTRRTGPPHKRTVALMLLPSASAVTTLARSAVRSLFILYNYACLRSNVNDLLV